MMLRKVARPMLAAAFVGQGAEALRRPTTAATQIGGGLLLATARLPRLASAALAATVLPANLGMHMFWAESDEVGKDLVEAAGERSAPLITSARRRGGGALESARDRAGALAGDAKSEARRLARH